MSLATRRDYVHVQGSVYYAERSPTTGAPGARRFLGNCTSLKIMGETNIIEHFESTSGQRLMDNRYPFGLKLNCEIIFDEYAPETMAMALKGTTLAVAGGTVAAGDDNMPPGMTVGSFFRTRFGNISGLTIVDDGGSPLTAGTHYRLVDAVSGRIEILNLGTFTQPFRPAYTYAGTQRIIGLNDTTPPELWIELDGINVAAQSKRVRVVIYRVSFNFPEEVAFLADDPITFTLSGAALRDTNFSTGANYTNFGEYFHMERLE